MVTTKANTNGASLAKKPKRRQGTPKQIEIIVGGRTRDQIDGKAYPTRSNPAKPKKTANDLMLDAWAYTYKTRQRRLTKP